MTIDGQITEEVGSSEVTVVTRSLTQEDADHLGVGVVTEEGEEEVIKGEAIEDIMLEEVVILKSNGYKRGRSGSFGPRSRLEDDDGDISMNDNRPTSSKRFSPYRGGRSNRGQKYYGDDNPSGFSRPGPHPSGKNTWYKVTIPKAKTAGKEFILKTLSENVEYSFTPVNFHFEQEKAVFHVQDKQVTSALHSLSSRIPMPSGMKMLFLIKPDRAPLFVSDEETEKLKVVMSNRYDPSTKSLNLTSLSSDQSLQSDGMTMNLSAAHVMTCVVKIIQENIPELECLDVSQNHISKLDGLSSLVEHTPNLTKLNLGANKLSYIEELRCLYKWKLTELNLDGNELCDKFKDQSSYVSAIRKKFPKVLRLDGHDLPPPIKFDLETQSELPDSKGNFFVNDEVKTLVVRFLKEFFTIYDSDNRQPLMHAYEENALFSLTAAFNPNIEYSQPKLSVYIVDSRNMLKNRDNARQNKCLKKGQLNVVSHLTQLPKTTHDYNSFVIDVDHCSQNLLSFSVEGVFKEGDSKSDRPPVRSFSRRFVTIPRGGGMVISNDMLTITNASRDQYQKAFKHPAPTPSSSPVPDASPAAPFPSATPQAGAAFSDLQQQMVAKFSEVSGMNNEWSINCLEQNNWDFEKAGQVFMDLKNQNKIPPEAFVK
ncbi:hypothetical protein FSP39_016397 [Pinctada imbricata]|uniref:Nuclear RNA export factor 1 n=1 Tax=Pinctada imbricata TaxID=66713 RepID=A0AA89C3N1_PINIB|nr:hypothetical protein FSP39_016397 [Pinctada imbricata]